MDVPQTGATTLHQHGFAEGASQARQNAQSFPVDPIRPSAETHRIDFRMMNIPIVRGRKFSKDRTPIGMCRSNVPIRSVEFGIPHFEFHTLQKDGSQMTRQVAIRVNRRRGLKKENLWPVFPFALPTVFRALLWTTLLPSAVPVLRAEAQSQPALLKLVKVSLEKVRGMTARRKNVEVQVTRESRKCSSSRKTSLGAERTNHRAAVRRPKPTRSRHRQSPRNSSKNKVAIAHRAETRWKRLSADAHNVFPKPKKLNLREFRAATQNQPIEIVPADGLGDVEPARVSNADLNNVSSPEIHRLVSMLGDANANNRQKAAAQLVCIGPEAESDLPALTKCLSDESPPVRATAAWAVWEINQRAKRSLSVLITLVESNDPGVSPLSAYILGCMGFEAAKALPVLRRRLVRGDKKISLHMAEAVAKIDPTDRAAVDVLMTALKDGNPPVRAQAAFALRSVDAEQVGRVVPPLTAALNNDDDPTVRTAAELTIVGFLESQESGLRGLTAYVLGTVGPDAEPLLPALHRGLADSRGQARLHLAEAVIKIDPNDQHPVDLLLGDLKSNNAKTRCQAAYALSAVGWAHANRVADGLTAVLDDSDGQVRAAAQLALARIRPSTKQTPPVSAAIDGGKQSSQDEFRADRTEAGPSPIPIAAPKP